MKLKVKVFLVTTIMVLTFMALLFLLMNIQTSYMVKSEESKQHEMLFSVIEAKMDEQLHASEISVLALANNSEVQRLFAKRDREALSNMLLPSFKAISSKVSQVQFHLIDSTSFLRLHQPQKFGDSLKDFRFTVNEANQNLKMVMGLEEGKGGYGFRVVVPMYYQGKHIGSVEYGTDFSKDFLMFFKENYGGEYSIFLFKDSKSVAWDDKVASNNGMLATTMETDTDSVPDSYLDELKLNKPVKIVSEDKLKYFLYFPFADYNGKTQGYIKIIQDRETVVQNMNLIKLRTGASIFIIGLIIAGLLTLILSLKFIKPILFLTDFLKKLSEGDLTSTFKRNYSFQKDEISTLYNSAKNLQKSLTGVLIKIQENSNISNIKLQDLVIKMEDFNHQLADVSITTEQLSAGMEQTAASTEEMGASSVEIENTVSMVAQKSEIGSTLAVSISHKAENIRLEAMNSEKETKSMYKDTNVKLIDAIEQSKAVEKINILSQSILQIAEQTNLLALNASIEAARAGEHGKGFAVVAEEIRKLSEQSKSTVSEIQNVTKDILLSVNNLSENSKNMLSFVDTKILEDYRLLVDTSEQYNNDAKYYNGFSNELSSTSEILLTLIQDMVKAIDEISTATNAGAQETQDIAIKTTALIEIAQDVAKYIEDARNSSNDMLDLVRKFKM